MLSENTNYGSTPWPPVTKKPRSKRYYPLVATIITITLLVALFTHFTEQSNSLITYITRIVQGEQEVIIEYDYDDYLDYLDDAMSGAALILDDIDSSFGSLTWLDFHHNLLSKQGYNDEMVAYTFKITDEGRRSGGGRGGGKGGGRGGSKGGGRGGGTGGKGGKGTSPTPKPTPKPVADGGSVPSQQSPAETNGNLKCFTKYKYGTIYSGDFTLDVDCFDENEDRSKAVPAQMTGCVSYGGKNKDRSGEFVDGNKCKVWSKSGESVGISARCCVAAKGSGFSVTASNFVTTETDYCADTECGGNGVELGCAGNVGTGDSDVWSSQLMGTKYCKSCGKCQISRHDNPGKMDGRKSYLELNTFCGQINGASLDCYVSEGKNPPNLQKTYKSTAMCSNGYSLVDCNAFIDKGIDQCYPYWENYGVSRGGYIDTLGFSGMGQVQCTAEATWMYIKAQARCCRVV